MSSLTTTLTRGLDRYVPRPRAAKVPAITAGFWCVKILSTGAGEAASDYLAGRDIVLAAGVGTLFVIAALWLQLRAHRYVPWIYWLAVSAVAVFGTMAADAVHVVLGVPYPVTSGGYAALTALTFWLWWRSQGTLDIHGIDTRRRETFYWVAVLSTFALGTAVGDLSAFTLGLGYLASAGLYALLILMPAIGWWRLRLPAVAAFWWAYVLTRPLGASIADWLGKPVSASGVGVGDGVVTLVAAVAIVVGVWLTNRGRRGTAER